MLVNLMPQSLRIMNNETGEIDVYALAKVPAIVRVLAVQIGEHAGYPLYEERVGGKVLNLPAPVPGVVYVTDNSVKIVAQMEGRDDVVSPTLTTAVRIKEGPLKGQIDYVVSLSA